jgi:hypothetical protein
MSILALTSDTLIGTPATGNLEYNGQFFGTDSAGSRAQLQRITRSTLVTCAGQTSIDFTSIPAWVERITVMFQGVSVSGTSNFLIQIGDSGGFENTGYVSGSFDNSTASNSTIGFIASSQQIATATWGGAITISNLSGNVWVSSGTIASGTAGYLASSGGAKTLTDVLDRVRITTVNGTDTFDTTPSAGTINIIYEG